MRIALIVHKLPPESLGGTQVYTWSLARALAAVGCQTWVFYPLEGITEREAVLVREGVHLWRVPVPPGGEGAALEFLRQFRRPRVERAFRRFLAQARPDIVHIQHLQNVSGRLVSLARGRPRVMTLHDYWYYCANGQLVLPDRTICQQPGRGRDCARCGLARIGGGAPPCWQGALGLPFAWRNRYLRRLAREVDLFISPSRFLRDRYIEQGWPAERIVVLENGLDLERLGRRKETGLPEPAGWPHFGFIGSLAWQKGGHVLIDAFAQLPATAALTIYGDESLFPPYVGELKARVRHPHIRFAGRLDHRDVGEALRQLDSLVVPSVWYENSPVVIQEAYTVGVPVVASRLGALPEKVSEGITGRLFAPGDSEDLARVLVELCQHPEMLDALRGNLKAAPSIEEHAARLLDFYRGLLAGEGPGSQVF